MLEAFLDFEAALEKPVVRLWEDAVDPAMPEIMTAVQDMDATGALDLISALSIKEGLEKRSNTIKLLMASCLTYGTTLIDPLKSSVFLEGHDKEILDASHLAFENMLTHALSRMVVRQAGLVVADLIEQRKVSEVFRKADPSKVVENAVVGNGRTMASIAANLTTSRLVNFGSLAQLSATGYTRYALDATLDTRTSKICRRLHGRQFEVKRAYEHLRRALTTTDPDELKQVAPWLKATKEMLLRLEVSNEADLQSAGIDCPPFHPRCRTVIRKVAEVVITGVEYTPVIMSVSSEDSPVIAAPAAAADVTEDWAALWYAAKRRDRDRAAAPTVSDADVTGQPGTDETGTPIRIPE